MSAGEGINYWLRTPELGDPVESYTKGACPDPQTGLTGFCDEGAGRASYNVGDGSSPSDPVFGDVSFSSTGGQSSCFIQTVIDEVIR